MPSVNLYRQPPCWKSFDSLIDGMDLAIFYDILSAYLGHFTLKIAELVATNHFVAPHPSYISVCGVDKKANLNSAASCALCRG